jgi:alpha/beta superfamily hydrolase
MSILIIPGPAGDLEVAIDAAQGDYASMPRALAVVAHPHPLHGGTMDNKVTTTLARACASAGCAVLRFNCRGVGRSAGEFDHSRGETDDAAAALAYLQTQYPNVQALVLCGFSFGTAVVTQLAQRLPNGHVVAMVLAGAAVQRFAPTATVHADITLLVHGECDETVPLAETLA